MLLSVIAIALVTRRTCPAKGIFVCFIMAITCSPQGNLVILTKGNTKSEKQLYLQYGETW